MLRALLALPLIQVIIISTFFFPLSHFHSDPSGHEAELRRNALGQPPQSILGNGRSELLLSVTFLLNNSSCKTDHCLNELRDAMILCNSPGKMCFCGVTFLLEIIQCNLTLTTRNIVYSNGSSLNLMTWSENSYIPKASIAGSIKESAKSCLV